MQLLDSFIVSDRIEQRRLEADAERLALAARRSRPHRASAWRRGGGAAARWLSRTAGSVAVTLDPSLCRPSYGRE
jgi:hypothetical protein